MGRMNLIIRVDRLNLTATVSSFVESDRITVQKLCNFWCGEVLREVSTKLYEAERIFGPVRIPKRMAEAVGKGGEAQEGWAAFIPSS